MEGLLLEYAHSHSSGVLSNPSILGTARRLQDLAAHVHRSEALLQDTARCLLQLLAPLHRSNADKDPGWLAPWSQETSCFQVIRRKFEKKDRQICWSWQALSIIHKSIHMLSLSMIEICRSRQLCLSCSVAGV